MVAQNDWWLHPLTQVQDDILDPVQALLVEALKDITQFAVKPAKVWPTMDSGVAITAGALDEADWQLGDFVDIISADAIDTKFKVVGITIEEVSAVGVYEIVLYKGDHSDEAEEEIARVRMVRGANVASDRLLVNSPVLDAGEQVSAKAASDAGAESVTIALDYIEVD